MVSHLPVGRAHVIREYAEALAVLAARTTRPNHPLCATARQLTRLLNVGAPPSVNGLTSARLADARQTLCTLQRHLARARRHRRLSSTSYTLLTQLMTLLATQLASSIPAAGSRFGRGHRSSPHPANRLSPDRLQEDIP